MRLSLLAALTVSVLAAACGSKGPASSTTPSGGAGPGAKPALPDVPWAQLDHEQREQFMAEKVMPAMAPLFQKHDAVRYAKFDCVTCHGPGALKGNHEMPTADLPVLNFADMSKWKPEDIEFMEKTVKPTMAAILKEPEYTKENPKGFGCLACHTMAK